MQWTDEGVVLAARKHGESAAIVELLTRAHGRHAGLVRGGAGRRARGVLQPGNEVSATWRARLPEHLGSYTVELRRERVSALLDEPLRLAGLVAVCATARAALPEREPHTVLHEGLVALLDAIETSPAWPAVLVRWELELLKELGFGLDLSRCAVSGTTDDLAYVSPRSGRAVSAAAAGSWQERLLELPRFLLGAQAGEGGAAEVVQGLRLTGHFLERHVFAPREHGMPAARTRFVERISRKTPTSSAIRGPTASR